MILFRLISFGLRILCSFLFVFILQIRWDKKPLEDYLVQFAESFFITQTLNRVGMDGVKTLRHLGGSKDKDSVKRQISGRLEGLFIEMEERLSPPLEKEK